MAATSKAARSAGLAQGCAAAAIPAQSRLLPSRAENMKRMRIPPIPNRKGLCRAAVTLTSRSASAGSTEPAAEVPGEPAEQSPTRQRRQRHRHDELARERA